MVLTKSLRVLIALFLISSVIAVGSSREAAASTVPPLRYWSQNIPDSFGNQLLSNLDNGVTAIACNTSNSLAAAEIFSPRGDRLYAIPKADQARQFCSSAVDRQGTVYGRGDWSGTAVVAMRGDVQLWKRSILAPGCQHPRVPGRLLIGADGFLYSVLSNGCGAGWYLVKYNPVNGAVVFSKEVDNIYSLVATAVGLVAVRERSVTTYDYNGDVRATVPFSAPVDINVYTVSNDGSVYFAEPDPVPNNSCPGLNFPTKRLVGYNITGEFYNRPLVACQHVSHLTVTPDRKVVFESTNASGAIRLVSLDSQSGKFIVERVLARQADDGRHYDVGVSLTADINGNVVYARSLSRSPGSYEQYAQEFMLLSAKSLALKQRFQTSALSNAAAWPWTFTSAIATGRLYVSANGDCGEASCARRLFGVSWPELGIDYPRGAVLNDGPLESVANYVVLGDSYSSGEGVESGVDGPKFEPPSDTNGCHRSYYAFGRQLDEALPNLRMQAGGFVACSGATVDDVRKGKNGEPSQLEALSPNTRVVSITVGGNDVKFAVFAEECLFRACGKDSGPYKTSITITKQTLPGKLEGLYREILQRAPNATLYVLGYPQLLPSKEQFNDPCTYFPENLRGKIDSDDYEGARSLVNELNTALRLKVNELKLESGLVDRIVYINPEADFIGHELCRKDPVLEYFNQPWEPRVYTFHPNREGQTAYMKALLPYVS